MNVEILARAQFALTISFHYLYPPLSIGLGVVLVILEGMFLKTKDVRYHNMSRFWTRIFGLTFAIGVATGIVMEFEFGTNWATYSRFVGDIFGSALAAEGIFAFFLESGFLAILLFGWNKVGPKMHFFSALMVCLGAHFSAIWIVVANSWMQTPAGYRLEVDGQVLPPGSTFNVDHLHKTRAVIENFWDVVFNPSSMDRLVHVILGAWLAGAFVVISISAYYLLKNQFVDFARRSMKVGLIVASISIVLQCFSGDSSADVVVKNQPVKLAAMEGLFNTQSRAPLSLIGWVDVKNQKKHAIEIPGLLSFLAHEDINKPVTGLNDFPKQDWPKVGVVFQMYHLMLAMAGVIFLVCAIALYLWFRKKLFEDHSLSVRFFLWILVFSVVCPQIANQAGWYTAEMGRQPWIVYGLLRTSEGLSKAVKAEQVLASIIMFGFVYLLLFALFVFLLHKKIVHGPSSEELGEKIPEGWQKYFRAE